MPSARLRTAPSLNVSAISESAVGATTAAPAPCTTRAMISHVELVASPPAKEPAANSRMPPTNIRRRPNRSPARPPSSSRPPNASEYALTTHSRSVELNRSARWIEGSATFTMVVSRTTISCANAITISATPRLRGAEVLSAIDACAIADCSFSALNCWGGLRHAQVFVDSDQAELQQLVAGKRRRCGGVVDDLGVDEGVVATLVRDDAPTRCLHVQVPRGVLAECARHEERVALWPHPQRRRVDAAGLAALVVEHAEDRHPAPPGDGQDERIDQTSRETDHATRLRTEIDAIHDDQKPARGSIIPFFFFYASPTLGDIPSCPTRRSPD